MKTRSLFLLISILIIGFILGFLSSSYIREKKAKEYRSYSSYESFINHSLGKLHPGEEQKKILLPIIEKYAEKNHDLKVKYREDFRYLMWEYRTELKPFLDEQQLYEMEQREKNYYSYGKDSISDGRHQPDSSLTDTNCP